MAVSEILLNYDYDKLVPVYGFGAVNNPKTDIETSTFFPCSTN
jgi:hypothetical protein